MHICTVVAGRVLTIFLPFLSQKKKKKMFSLNLEGRSVIKESYLGWRAPKPLTLGQLWVSVLILLQEASVLMAE